jgi:hypothetical protein
MRAILVAILLWSPSQAAFAQFAECPSIQKPSARLACYDKATLQLKSQDSATAKSSDPSVDPAVDRLSAENKRLDAKINNICRGC